MWLLTPIAPGTVARSSATISAILPSLSDRRIDTGARAHLRITVRLHGEVKEHLLAGPGERPADAALRQPGQNGARHVAPPGDAFGGPEVVAEVVDHDRHASRGTREASARGRAAGRPGRALGGPERMDAVPPARRGRGEGGSRPQDFT